MHAAACSLSPHIVCRELGLPIELVEVDRKTHRTGEGEDFLRINGNGYVPVLRLEDGRRTGGPRSFNIRRSASDAGLLASPGTMARTQTQSRLNSSLPSCKADIMPLNPTYAPVRAPLLELA
jgi:glutathione S-transferase